MKLLAGLLGAWAYQLTMGPPNYKVRMLFFDDWVARDPQQCPFGFVVLASPHTLLYTAVDAPLASLH